MSGAAVENNSGSNMLECGTSLRQSTAPCIENAELIHLKLTSFLCNTTGEEIRWLREKSCKLEAT